MGSGHDDELGLEAEEEPALAVGAAYKREGLGYRAMHGRYTTPTARDARKDSARSPEPKEGRWSVFTLMRCLGVGLLTTGRGGGHVPPRDGSHCTPHPSRVTLNIATPQDEAGSRYVASIMLGARCPLVVGGSYASVSAAHGDPLLPLVGRPSGRTLCPPPRAGTSLFDALRTAQ